PSSVRRQLSQSSGLGVRSIASVTGVNARAGEVAGLCAARGASTSTHSAATPTIVRMIRVFIRHLANQLRRPGAAGQLMPRGGGPGFAFSYGVRVVEALGNTALIAACAHSSSWFPTPPPAPIAPTI